MIDSPTVSGVEEIRSLATWQRPAPLIGERSVRDTLAALSIVEEVLRLLPADLSVVGVGGDQIQLRAKDFFALFHGLRAKVTRSTSRDHFTLWVRDIAITACHAVEHWQVPQLEASIEVVPEA